MPAPKVPVHVVAHPPQWAGDVSRSTHRSVHFVRGGVHADTQPVGEHKAFGVPHCAEHPPQVDGLDKSASHPSAAFPLQSRHPGSQDAIAHACPAQLVCACGSEHSVHEPHP
jgi:hypothetical protein